MITLPELVEKLKREDEVLLLELLDLRSEDLIERFIDKIEERFDVLASEFDDSNDYRGYGEKKELTGELTWSDDWSGNEE